VLRPSSVRLATLSAPRSRSAASIYLTLNTSFERNQTASNLLRLPAELRLEIWKFTLGGHAITHPIFYKDFHRPHCCPYDWARTKEGNHVPEFLNLLYVCRQIYQEARLLPFSCNVCEFRGYQLRHKGRAWFLVFEAMTEEQRNTIAWVSFESAYSNATHLVINKKDVEVLRSLKGLKAVIRDRSLHASDKEAIQIFAEDQGCRIIDE
jgi:hypothetical protein